VIGREHHSALPAEREADDRGAVRVRGVQHRERVGCVFRLRVGGGVERAVGPAVAAPVERQHAEIAGEVGELELPAP